MEFMKVLPWILVVILVLLILNGMLIGSQGEQGMWVVYGTLSCGWTRKQLDHLKEKKIPHKFVNCDSENCGGFRAYPTNIKPNGVKVVGFTQSN